MADEIDEDGEEGQVVLTVGKPRLKWTRQLHDHFVDAVSRLGGPDKATPKSLVREMGIPGLALYHIKSHLQKYRLEMSRDSAARNKKQDVIVASEGITARADDKISHPESNEAMLKKLEERIEVQKHLQLRMEAEGKYLQSVLSKVQETIAAYSSSTAEIGEANDAIKELVSAVHNERVADSAADSCLTSMNGAELRSVESVEIDPTDGSRRTGRVLGIREEIDLNK